MKKYTIRTYNKISEAGLSIFPPEKYEISPTAECPDAILLRSAYIKDQPIPPSVLAIARSGAGVNNIPVDLCTEMGIPVFNTPGANANAVKEMVLAALFVASRNIAEAIEWMDTIKDRDDVEKLVEDGKSQFVGPEIFGKTLGIIGLGAVGGLVANAATSLGMKVYGYDPYISVDNAWGLSRAVIHANDISEIYANCDYITLHVPLTDKTKGKIDEDAIARMRDNVRILNFSRGELVDNDSVVSAVRAGKIACYITDFPNQKLVGIKGIVTIPHLGASTPESEDNCANMAARALIDYLERGSIANSVNFPRCDPPQIHTGRVTLFNKNIPGMLSMITTVASCCGYNIETFSSSTNKGSATAYTVLDLDKEPDELFVKKLRECEGVFRVRIIG